MASPKNGQAEFLAGAKTLIENASGIPEMAAALAAYGYDAARFEEGKSLWNEADGLVKRHSLDSGSSSEGSQKLDKSWTEANSAYMKTLKVARIRFEDDARAVTALKLCGPRKQSLSGWLDQAGTFYANLAADPGLMEGLSRFGYTRSRIEAESALVEDVRREGQARVQGKGSAQASTVERDRKLRELDSWVSDLRSICRIAFYENPQELEKLGVLALNGPRRAAAKAKA